jgi:hypothetical protein
MEEHAYAFWRHREVQLLAQKALAKYEACMEHANFCLFVVISDLEREQAMSYEFCHKYTTASPDPSREQDSAYTGETDTFFVTRLYPHKLTTLSSVYFKHVRVYESNYFELLAEAMDDQDLARACLRA